MTDKFEDMGIIEMAKTLGEMGKDLKEPSNYARGFREGAEQMAYRAIQIRNKMKDKKSLAGNLWYSEEEIENAINEEAEKISARASSGGL